MKVSTNIIQFYNKKYGSAPDPLEDGLEPLLKRIGGQLGAVEEVEPWGPCYDGIVVAKVVSCEPHSNSDHLHVCLVDDGGATKDVERNKDGFVEVVCGAPNVAAGQSVAWIPPGIAVPSTVGKEPFILDVRDIRGVRSNGMIASCNELGISDNHDGILVIEASEVGEELMKPGTPFKNLYGLDDVIIDIENKMFTHRPDCFGQLGIARELAGISGKAYISPEWYRNVTKHESEDKLELNIKNEVTDQVPRFMAQAMSNIAIGPSPIWRQAYLTRIGIKSINNIVDLTNYFMSLTAQPLHAFDYDKVKAKSGDTPTLQPRMASEGEELKLIGGKTIKLKPDDIVIATDKEAVGLAGIMGGADTEVDEHTKNIILECANFDMYTVRRSSMRHGLFTDASTRFTKGQSPLQNDRVLARIVEDIKTDLGGKVASEAFDVSADPGKFRRVSHVKVSPDFINARLGAKLSASVQTKLLESVEFVVKEEDNQLVVAAPFWRTDIEIAEDIVEEIGRLHSYNDLPQVLPKTTLTPAPRSAELDKKQHVRERLSAAGANELLSYSFVNAGLLKKVGQDPEKAFHIRNALSPDLQHYRLSLTPSLLEKVHPNIKSDLVRSDDNEFALFEINKVHCRGYETEEKVPVEFERIALVFASDEKTAKRKYEGAAFYQALRYLNELAPELGANLVPLDGFDAGEHEIFKQLVRPFEPKRSAVVLKADGNFCGVVGEFRSSLKTALKLPLFSAGFEIFLSAIDTKESQYAQLSSYPKTLQDITFKVPADVTYGQLHKCLKEELATAQTQHGYAAVIVPRDIYQSDDAASKNITFRIWLSRHERTLTTEEVNTLLGKISEVLRGSLGAERV